MPRMKPPARHAQQAAPSTKTLSPFDALVADARNAVAAAGTAGIDTIELSRLLNCTRPRASRALGHLVTARTAHRAAINRRVYRYFDFRRNADAWVNAQRNGATRKQLKAMAGDIVHKPIAMTPGGMAVSPWSAPSKTAVRVIDSPFDRPPLIRAGALDFKAHPSRMGSRLVPSI